jgi:hypothetical protein
MRQVVAAVAALVVAAGVVGLRVAASGRSDLATAESCRASGLDETALDYYARAARWYLPGAGVHRLARARLLEMAADAERAGHRDLALRAYREVRGAIRSTRWLVTPDEDLLATADGAIARLVAAQDRELRGEGALDEAGHRDLLARDASPSPWMSLAVVLLFLAWVGVLVRGAWRGVHPDGTVAWRVVGLHAAASAVLLVLWLVALRLA